MRDASYPYLPQREDFAQLVNLVVATASLDGSGRADRLGWAIHPTSHVR